MITIQTAHDQLRPNPDWAKLPLFDRKGWKKVRFGDVVRMLKEQVDPVSDGVDRYVAGEHMETENVHIRKWGNVGDGYLGPAFIRRFRKGQVLYGSRRTYLKKVAVAEWDGVTANTTFVLEAVQGKLLPELLPWLMLSERFTKHSIQESKGSTNPYINFPDIAKFEFALPPLDQQRRIAEMLWACDAMTQLLMSLRRACCELEKAICAVLFSEPPMGEVKQHWLRLSGQALLDKGYLLALQDGNHGGEYPRSHEFATVGLVYLSATNISEEGVVDFASCPRLPKNRADALRIGPAQGGDVILTNNATVGRVAILPLDSGEIVASTSTTYYRPDPALLNRAFLAVYMKSAGFQKQLSRVMVQSTRNQVPITAQKKLTFVIPPLHDQEVIVSRLDEIGDVRAHVEGCLGRTRDVQRAIIGHLFEGQV
jgi:type I restriction enzyme S subunit